MFINEFSIDKAVQRTRVNQSGKMSIRENGNIGTKNIGGITFFGRNGVGRKSTFNRNRGEQEPLKWKVDHRRNQRKQKEKENGDQRGQTCSSGPLSAHEPVDCNHLIMWSLEARLWPT